ncbi:MAG: DUF167 domain-containing protein [Desulfomonilia bacterium]|nr:DUF167 domain-containing protein [Desulfomonilia bacterium]
MWIRGEGDSTIIALKIIPHADRDAFDEIRENRLVVRLRAPAVDGKANTALVKFFSKRFGLAKSRISIIQGEKSRTKIVSLEGIEPQAIRSLLEFTR